MACHYNSHVPGVLLALFVLGGIPLAPAATGQPSDFLRKVDVLEVERNLQVFLAELLSGHSVSATQRLAAIEARSWQTFQALPKNAAGRLSPQGVRYLVHTFFAKEHGWLIKGLEPHGMQLSASQVHEVSILQDKVPLLVERLLEVRQADRGLALGDVVAMIAVLERLMFNESMTLLELAYELNSLSMEEDIDEETLHKVLKSYVLLFSQGSKASVIDAPLLQAILESGHRPDIADFEHDTVLNLVYATRHQANPFRTRKYSFQATSEIMQNLAQNYGKWQNHECLSMKAHLAELDPEGRGRVPLGLFYAQPPSGYTFSESAEYLRQIGALDESSSAGPQVLIANYVAGPSNCIASSSYYSVCCLSECDSIFSELEHHVLAPTASPQRLLTLIRNVSSVHGNGELPEGLPEKLHTIAEQHGGDVPLHGRLFAQWLHFAFPRECPYPSVLESAMALTPSQWLPEQYLSSAEERQEHLASPLAPSAEDFNIDALWSEQEVLPIHGATPSSFASFTGVVRTMAQLAAVLIALRSAWTVWRVGTAAYDGVHKKNDDSLYV